MKIKNITWETDGEEVDLPTEVDLPKMAQSQTMMMQSTITFHIPMVGW